MSEMDDRPLRADFFGIAVTCATCGRRKKPVGRSAPIGLSLCDYDCEGFYRSPRSGSLWPGESEADFGYPVANVGTTAAV